MSLQIRVRKLINLDIKKEIISKEEGQSVDLSAEYGLAKWMISIVFFMVTLL